MVVSCCNHVSHVRSSASSSLTLSRVPLFWWVLVTLTVTPFLLYQATPSSLHKFPKHLFPLLGLLWLWVWCFLYTPAKTHSTTVLNGTARPLAGSVLCLFGGWRPVSPSLYCFSGRWCPFVYYNSTAIIIMAVCGLLSVVFMDLYGLFYGYYTGCSQPSFAFAM